jgi:dihydroorotate dehydrogenase (fumarate)
MNPLATTYMGLKLTSPIIVGSSGLTNKIDKLVQFSDNGAGAVVLKSLFEEQIRFEAHKTASHSEESFIYPEAQDYISNYARTHHLDEYLQLISEARKKTDIPIIASINCVSADEWTSFAKNIEKAGASALELNVYVLPSNPETEGMQNEKIYLDIASQIVRQLQIPVAMKIGYHFSGLSNFVRKLSWTGVKGIVMFNRFFAPDIDIKDMKVMPTHVFSSPEEISLSLRWIALLADVAHCDLAASTGIHDATGVIKQLLAGATATQITSVLYKKGPEFIKEVNNEVIDWMKQHNYDSVDEFRGKLSYKSTSNPAAFERVQFMKHFAGIE